MRRDTLDTTKTVADVIHEKFEDMETAGYEVEFDPEEAELAGAFEEDALSYDDAQKSAIDSAESKRP